MTYREFSKLQTLYRYEKYQWSIRNVIQHFIDSERVFTYRAMRFARNDRTVLSSFDQNDYIITANADKYAL